MSILVVDDVPSVRSALSRALRANGYSTREAANGREALLAMSNKMPQLVILDLSMPEMDGITFLHHIRSSPGTANLPVIVVTGVSDPTLISEISGYGIQGFMRKSQLSVDVLYALVDRVLPAPSA